MTSSPDAKNRKLEIVGDVIVPNHILVSEAKEAIKNHFKKNVHHVACILVCNDRRYLGLHLDNQAFDICAEPVAISDALKHGESKFLKIVSVHWSGIKGEEPQIIIPCPNCKQIIFEHLPNVEVIIGEEAGKYKTIIGKDLNPHPYRKPM